MHDWCFFFSSRRRHTRYWRDWSSDVCSSDLAASGAPSPLIARTTKVPAAALTDSPAGRVRTASSSAARIGGAASQNRPPLTGEGVYTLFFTPPAPRAVSPPLATPNPPPARHPAGGPVV